MKSKPTINPSVTVNIMQVEALMIETHMTDVFVKGNS